MKIKEYLITRYGPLKNKEPFQLKDFNLFWGKNEEGKTLTIDALVKLLLGRNTRDFERIERVEENPEGYVIILDDRGQEVKLPEKGDLTKVVDLTPSECCNIFIVRNSNLSVARDVAQESEFYTNVTDRLTGLRTKEISKIKEILREIAKITPEGTFRNIKDEKLKTRMSDANLLEGKINDLVKEMKEKGFDKLEEEAARQREEIKRITKKIESLEDARKREKYEKGKEALGKLKEFLEKFKDLEIYNQDDEQLWRDCEKEVKNYTEQKEKLHTELKEIEEKSREIIKKLSEVERDFMVFNDRKKILDNDIIPELKEYMRKSENLAQQERKSKFFSLVGIISAILLGISLLGVIFSSSLLLFYILVVLFSISAVISGIFRLQFVRDKAWLAGAFERIKSNLSKFGLDSEDIAGINFNIQRFEEEYQKKHNELQQIEKEKGILEGKIIELRDKRIPDIENKIKDANEKMDRIKTKSKEGSLEEYTEKFKLKQKVERSIEEQNIILKSYFGEKSKELKENIPYWGEEIGRFEEYKDKAKDIKYSETVASELEVKRQELEKKLKEINDRMLFFQKEMLEVERKVNEILRLEEEYLYCKTTVDLEAIKGKLRGFINENESNRDNALKVIEIFEEIEAEEKEKVSELFGKNSPISKYFNEITGGLYKEVIFNQGKIEVIHSDGTILGADKLSGGSYDQLYFSIRLALGEKLLKGKKGFFIMDDPFVKADPERLQRQVEMLKKISKLGWQVIYFSAKGEIKDAFKEDIDRGTINYVEL
jgi:DNA repair exonuclease SbcCD ATPase subunit